MSKEVDRHTVFQTTRVRTPLKNDVCWIHKSKQEQEASRTDHAVETRPASVKRYSYVLSTAKKFDDSSNQANFEVIPPQEDAQPEGSTVETTDDAKPQAPIEELIQKDEAHPEKTVANTTAEIKEEYAAVYQSNVEQNGVAAEVSADAHVEDPVVETSAVPVVELKPKEKPTTKTEPANATQLEHAGAQSIVHPAEGSCEKGPSEQATEEIVEAVAEVAVESSADTSDVVNVTLIKEVAFQESVGAVAEAVTKPSSGMSDVVNATPGKEAALQDSVDAVDEVAVESSPETPAVTDAAGENAALQVTCPDLVENTASETSTQAAAEEPEEFIVESAASAEPVLKTGAEEVVQCEVQPVYKPVVEQSVEPERAADHVVERTIKDAVEPVTYSDAEAQDEFSDQLIQLSEALDVEPPTTEAAPEPLKDPKRSHTEENKLNQHSDSNISDMSQRSKEDRQSTQTQDETRNSNVCSFCEKIIDGKVKIYISEPVVTCHPDCLKCGVCAKPLGDMMTPMFLHDQMVQCGGCFADAFKTRT
ncbi:uncharacterized protein si:dkey-125i10.3 isoform X2 [Cyclopterus lumpus]|uniref:uncharacterized protein si:dkey-125i10.3 isoform X2 n=1 Tax=Cyclopterus lumpus TaxID=8103 RepID=UPI0014865E70|nr:uncharacterized protein si:dkey-125i10.3 isoform X2 [Cyclopterus lumpus]